MNKTATLPLQGSLGTGPIGQRGGVLWFRHDVSNPVPTAVWPPQAGHVDEETLRELAASKPGELMCRMRGMTEPDLANAAEFLGTFAGQREEVVEFLVTLCEHDNPRVRERAVYGLSHQSDALALTTLGRLSEQDNIAAVREAASEALELKDV